ncbi:glycosyltransferase family 39 protein [Fluoribacter dumoffii]|uniref:Glycosyltransferase RgtA/B/C/D-like domain-containing protein n=1 Tax=Fluoribacter dumoffii TaxID=463 RepID=A0A377GCD4_9GAMM|nr:glycosyltransferase family 39 protein [Fluoribacter dumoffii]KTC90770.1 hypothetical protein Ldum_1838 [Fluoribacter dumoffii NY 23]MCW8386450.1 glycosyltransferase family 39 protein [Fluoribacter dumoffii]MCW8419503.1 glycosyltransferase family 39 protein [Fluoribacter dumoffii]MCW8452622.1 glycosyltransferase family 39 protein [Fluoribacter dumoffii]MCW8460127.1 glycosyltransferase family 39 protein [Fluoribacter dumoffii]
MLFPIKKNSILSSEIECPSYCSIFSLILYSMLIWWLAHVISDANLDKYDDMLESYAWGSLWSWGHDKHPPLFGWIAAAWFQIFPHTNEFFYLLSYAVVALGLLGVFCLTPFFMSNVLGSSLSNDAYLQCCKKFSFLSVALLLLAFPYTTLAAKYNANSILLMLWPWTIYGFLKATQKSQSWLECLLNSFFFGLMAALSMLGKYFSGILLLTLLFVSLLPLYRSWYRSFSPYLSLLIFCICLAPHFYWLTQHNFPTLVYLQAKGDGKIHWIFCLKFLFVPLLYWCIPWYVVLVTFFEGPWYQRMVNSWRAIHLKNDALWWIAILPFIFTLLAGFLGFVKLTYPWAIPLGLAFPLLWLRNSLLLSPVKNKKVFQPLQLKTIGFIYLCVVIFIAVGIRIYAAYTQDVHYYLSQKEAAVDIFKYWHELYPSEKPAWIVAEKKAASLSFYNKSWDKVKVYPSFPSAAPASYNAAPDWDKGRGVIYCFVGQDTYSVQQRDSLPCVKKAAFWLQQRGYTDVVFKIFHNHREGLLFPKPLTFSFAVFFAKKEKNI